MVRFSQILRRGMSSASPPALSAVRNTPFSVAVDVSQVSALSRKPAAVSATAAGNQDRNAHHDLGAPLHDVIAYFNADAELSDACDVI